MDNQGESFYLVTCLLAPTKMLLPLSLRKQ